MKQNQTKDDGHKTPRWCNERGGSVILSVKVQPRSSKNKVILPDDSSNFVKITITAPPVDSAANEKLIEFLSDILDCPKNAIQIIKGHTSRMKIIEIYGITISELIKKFSGS